MATLQQIKDQVDSKLATLWTAIQNKEAAYFSANGRYWQGLRTHTVNPADGVEVLPNIGTSAPAYQGDPYPTAIRNTAMPMSIEIHQYRTPAGVFGYQAWVYVTVLGETYTRSAQVGPESWRSFGWTKVTAAL